MKRTKPDTRLTYFAADGSYGGADGIITIDTTDWDASDWETIDNCQDHNRLAIARLIQSARKEIR